MNGYLPGLEPLWRAALVDPPWPEKGGGGRGAQEHYQVVDARGRRDVTDAMSTILRGSGRWLPYEDAHLYLWATTTYLPSAVDLFECLGFTYVNAVVWAKTSMGIGQYFRGQHELLLFGVRGQGRHPSVCTTRRNLPNLLVADHERGENGKRIHSAKPKAVYDLVEARSHGPYAEFFCRGSGRPGWTVWGNEAVAAKVVGQ